MLSDLQHCTVLLHGPLQALYLEQLQSCHIQAGPVGGATFGEHLTGCTLMLATHQLRLHSSSSTDVYIRPGSDPIIEHCSAIRFAPLQSLPYDGFDEALQDAELPADAETCSWSNVQDFQHPGHKQTSNWSVVPEGERQHAQADAPATDT